MKASKTQMYRQRLAEIEVKGNRSPGYRGTTRTEAPSMQSDDDLNTLAVKAKNMHELAQASFMTSTHPLFHFAL